MYGYFSGWHEYVSSFLLLTSHAFRLFLLTLFVVPSYFSRFSIDFPAGEVAPLQLRFHAGEKALRPDPYEVDRG
jgi:hypothetical protein